MGVSVGSEREIPDRKITTRDWGRKTFQGILEPNLIPSMELESREQGICARTSACAWSGRF
jgi:hypothetical protein